MTASTVFTRAQWGALAPKAEVARPLADITTVFAHYSDTAEQIPSPSVFHDVLVVQAIQRDHMFNRGYLDIAYAALIGGNGDIYLGRPNNVVQAAVLGKNTSEWSVCFLTDREITAAQETSFEFLLYLAELNFVNVSHVPEPHSEATATDCPGDAIRAWLTSKYH